MSFLEQLEEEPLSEVVRYRSGAPQDAIAFTGTLRKHPYDEDKCILLADRSEAETEGATPAGYSPAILEFRKEDVQGVEEMPSPVDNTGHPRQIMRIWVRRGSYGLRYEPFEVDHPLRFPGASTRLHERILSKTRG
jgi:hypothetical protein